MLNNIKKIIFLTITISSFYANAANEYYGVISTGFSQLTPQSTASMQTLDVNGSGIGTQLTLGRRINNIFALELGFSNNSSVKVKNRATGKTIDIEYNYTTLGVAYKPFANSTGVLGKKSKISPFVKFGLRRFHTNYEEYIANKYGVYLGVGADINLFNSEDYKIRASHVRYSKDSSTSYVGLIVDLEE